MKTALIIIGLTGLILLSMLYWTAAKVPDYNAHVCQVYGYQPDCKTPIGRTT